VASGRPDLERGTRLPMRSPWTLAAVRDGRPRLVKVRTIVVPGTHRGPPRWMTIVAVAARPIPEKRPSTF